MIRAEFFKKSVLPVRDLGGVSECLKTSKSVAVQAWGPALSKPRPAGGEFKAPR